VSRKYVCKSSGAVLWLLRTSASLESYRRRFLLLRRSSSKLPANRGNFAVVGGDVAVYVDNHAVSAIDLSGSVVGEGLQFLVELSRGRARRPRSKPSAKLPSTTQLRRSTPGKNGAYALTSFQRRHPHFLMVTF
jgi:hypothetical protein